jgi:cell division transport system permease protein
MMHLKTAWNTMRRSPFQAMSAVFVLTLTFFVITVLSVLVFASSQVIKHFETRPQIIAFLTTEAKEEEIAGLQQKLVNDTRVKQVKYITKDEALKIYKEATSENPLLSELVSPSIFPASLEISLQDLSYAQEVIDQVKADPTVSDVGFTASLKGQSSLGDVVSRLRNVTWYLRVGGAALAIFLAGTSFLVLVVIIGMRMTSRRGEIEILKLIGATSGFIRNPIILEAIMYAVLGTLLGWVLAFMLVLYSTPSLLVYFKDIPILPKDTLHLFSLFGIILATELVISIFLALFGSTIALSRARKR